MTFDEQLQVVRASRQLHSRWYGETYPELAQSGMTAAEHYLTVGAQKGYNPGRFFETSFYISRYPDVVESGLNPLVHYETIGAAQDRFRNETAAKRAEKAASKGSFVAGANRERSEVVSAAEAAARAVVQSEIDRLLAGLRSGVEPGSPLAGRFAELTQQAQDAQGAGKLAEADRLWRAALSVPAEPFVRLAEIARAQGDVARAEEVLREGLERLPRDPLLLQAYCQSALAARRWSEAARRWEMIVESKVLPDPVQQIAVAEAHLKLGQAEKARALLEAARGAAQTDAQRLSQIDALLAEVRADWQVAAQFWQAHATATRSKFEARRSFLRAVRAYMRVADFDAAEALVQQLVADNPAVVDYLKISAELAIAQNAWVVALERWQRVEAADPALVGTMPAQWVYQIGIEAAERRTENIHISRLRAAGMFTLARAVETVDEAPALLLARRARRQYPAQVAEMTARILRRNTRQSAAIWWLRRLIAREADAQPYYAMLVECLLESSRLDDCRALMEDYLARYPRDVLWLRAMMEIHYREGRFEAMRDVMAEGLAADLPKSVKSVRATRWIYNLIRLHPEPQSFLPEIIHDLVVRVATAYDSSFLGTGLATLLNPAKGEEAARRYRAEVAGAAAGEIEMTPVMRDEMLQFFLRRREWDQIDAILDLPLPETLTEDDLTPVWNLVRNRIDILLGRGDVAGAEAAACRFLDQIAAIGSHGFVMTLVTGLLFRLPVSEAIVTRLEASAERLGFGPMRARIAEWKARYVGFDPAPLLGCATRKRCFIVGNAPSIAQLPLHLLEGEDIFSVNRGMRALDVGLPQPKYLVVADPLVYKNHAREIDNDGKGVERFFVAANCLWRNPPTVPCVPLGSSGLKLSMAPFQPAPLHLHRGETVVVLAAQIAWQMGYREIYIIGVDLDYSGPTTHFYVASDGGKKESERLANFRPGGSGTEMVNLAFGSLQTVVAADGCRMFNAAPGGKLDVLPRVDFETVLRKADVAQTE